MHPVLRLFEDTIAGGSPDVSLPALPRMIFVVHGVVTIGGKRLHDGEAWHGDEAATMKAGKDGVTVWRYELAPPGATGGAASGQGVRSLEKLTAPLATIPKGDLLLRGDSVAFPPDGCAFLHKHWVLASAACLMAASASTRWAIRPAMGRAAHGTRPAAIRCSRRPRPTATAASSAS